MSLNLYENGELKKVAGNYKVDSVLSDTSTNAVQNKVIKSAIDSKQDKTDANLTTTSKEIVGAVNELNQNLTPKMLASANDLNELKQTAYYICNGVTPSNAPTTASLVGSLTVYANADNTRVSQTLTSKGVTYTRVYGGSSWSAWTEAISNKADQYTSSVSDLNTLLGKGIFQGACKASSNAYCPTTDSSIYNVLSISFDSTHCMQMAILYHGYGTQKTYVRQYLNSWSSWVQL